MTKSTKEKILKDFDSKIKLMIENEVLYHYNTLIMAQDSADTLNKIVRQFIETSIAQTLAEERAMVVAHIKDITGEMRTSETDKILSFLDKLTDKE